MKLLHTILIVFVTLALMLLPSLTQAQAAEPVPPYNIPNNTTKLLSRWVDVTDIYGRLATNWNTKVVYYLNQGYFVQEGPTQMSGRWYVLVCKWAVTTTIAPAVLMVPAPQYGGATYCQMYPYARSCYNPNQ